MSEVGPVELCSSSIKIVHAASRAYQLYLSAIS